jgi:hypothetical protein
MLMSVSFTIPRSTGTSGGILRWLNMSSTMCIADALVGMCEHVSYGVRCGEMEAAQAPFNGPAGPGMRHVDVF